MSLRRIDVACGAVCAALALFSAGHALLDPLPHPQWALAAALAMVGAVLSTKG